MTAQMRVVDMATLRPGVWQDVAAGVPHADLTPAHGERQVLLLRVNGAMIPRAFWYEAIEDGERIEWLLDPPGDRESFRTVLQVAAIGAALLPGLEAAAPYLAAASFAYNLLLPPHQPDLGAPGADIFSASIAGNIAALDEPIPRTYGIDKVTPRFAAQPYVKFVDDDGDDDNNQQYFYAVLAVGVGPYDLLADFLGKTPVSHYQDVLIHAMLPPGEYPSIASASIWTSQDIGNFELDTLKSPGSYPACPPGRKVKSVGIDITAAEGLGWVDSEGDARSITVEWRVQVRNIDDAGAPIGRFRTLATESRTKNTNTAQRWSGEYPVDPPARVEVRVVRINETQSGNATIRDSIQWVGLRGESDVPAPLNPDVTHYEIVLRASQNLSQVNQSAIALLIQGRIRTWNPDSGWNCVSGDWSNYVADAARSPSWAIADALSDEIYGEALPDERIDLQSLYELDSVWRSRQDRCDYTFVTTGDAWSAGQLLARTGRARMFRRYGIRAFKRDQLEVLPVTMFTPRMCVAGTKMSVDETLPSGDASTFDGIIAQFKSNAKWDSDFVECPCPGVSEITSPVYRQYPGVQGRTHAQREGLYDAASMALRQRTVSLTTEMQAELAAFFDPVLWQPQIADYGQAGDVVDWDIGALMLETTEPIDFTVTPVYMRLRRDDGSMTDAFVVTPGISPFHVTLPAAPDFELICDDGTRERPQFQAGPIGSSEIVKIASLDDAGRTTNGAPYWKVTAIPDDDRVHQADNALLPGPGDAQDPIGLPGDDAGGGGGDGTEIVYLSSQNFGDGDAVNGGGNAVGLDLHNDGSAAGYAQTLGALPFALQWISSNPVDSSTAGQYEALVSISTASGTDPLPFLVGDAVDTWVNLGTSRSWHVVAGMSLDRDVIYFQISIRSVDDGVVQATATYTTEILASNLH